MTGSRSASAVLDSALDQLKGLLEAVREEDLAKPTPCTDWSVSQLLDHIVRSTSNLAVSMRGGKADWNGPAPHHDDPVAAFESSADELRAALEDAGGDIPVDWQLAELGTHAWDLATALGRDSGELDPEVAERGLAFMSASMAPDQRGESFGPEQPAPDDADPYQRLAAFAGRPV